MQRAIELTVHGKTLRGMEHIPAPTEGMSAETIKVPVVIIFHGFTGHKLGEHRMYWKLSKMLESMGIASFRFDFSGSGESDGRFEEMTLSTELKEAQAILDFVRHHDAVDENAISLFGHSLGGVVASATAASNPAHVQKLILLCAAGNMREAIGQVMEEVKAQLQGRPFPPAYDNDGDLVGAQFAEELMEMDLFELAKGFDKPVLLINGTKDEAVPVEVAHRYKELCYGDAAVLQFVEGADHSFNRHDWEETMLQGVNSFLS